MKSLWLLLLLVLLANSARAESPHGPMKADCGSCHGADDWSKVEIPADFNHNEFDFQLRGAHKGIPCKQCHESLVFSDAPQDCSGCHADVHQGEFGLDCDRCHGTRSFIDRGDQLRLHRSTRFPLRGSHYTQDCESCHPSSAGGQLVYVNTPTECVSCHRDDYEAAKSPDHVMGNFSQDCELCHSPTLWRGASFNHASTGFPLDGAHKPLDCSECHTTGSFSGLDPACYSCHEQDYLSTNDPDHQSMGFGTSCEQCHNTTRWDDANFDHDGLFFPIYSGRHQGTWNDCTDCHVNASNYAVFSCIDCHAHSNQSDVDADHSEVRGTYIYESNACYDCHPRGR